MTRVASAALAVALCALVWTLLHFAWYHPYRITDYPTYKMYGDAMVHRSEVPYLDFRPEYPPAAMPMFALPAVVDRHVDYRHAFQLLMAICYTALVLCVLNVGGRTAAALAAVAPLALGAIVLSRYDFWPAALAVGAVVALLRRHPILSGVLLGTAFAAKLWPAVLVPLLVVWLLRNEGRSAVYRWATAAVATAAAWFVPFVIVAPHGVGHSFYQQFARPLQIESLGASVLIAVHHVFGTTLGTSSSFGSQNVAGPGVHAVTLATGVVEVAAVLAVWIAFARGAPSVERLFVSCAAVVAALIVFGKVYSPQFGIWLIPFVVLLRSVTARVLLLLAFVLTQVEFPKRYWNYATGFHAQEVLVVLVRNLTVLALFTVLTVTLLRGRAKTDASSS